jgi:hypothetical protein
MSHLRRAALILSLGTAISLSAAGAALAATPAQPSARAAEAARVVTEMKAQLAYKPTGRIIDSSRISYDHGSMIVAFDVSPDFTCPTGDVCFFTKVSLKGTAYEVRASSYTEDTYYKLETWYPASEMRLGSVRNYAAHRVLLVRASRASLISAIRLRAAEVLTRSWRTYFSASRIPADSTRSRLR